MIVLMKIFHTHTKKTRYVQQYVKIFTEEGRKVVSIKHNQLEKSTQTNENSVLSNSALKKPMNTSVCLTGAPYQSLFVTNGQQQFVIS